MVVEICFSQVSNLQREGSEHRVKGQKKSAQQFWRLIPGDDMIAFIQEFIERPNF